MKDLTDIYTGEFNLRKDYRMPENRREYFDALYSMNLHHGVMPGLVYLYMPELAEHFRWDDEQKLWFAVINGCTQNPITSLIKFNKFPEPPATPEKWGQMNAWFNAHWSELQFDTDRLKNKRNTVKALFTYWKAVKELAAGSQARFWSGLTFKQAWERADMIFSFGRLSKFSYLEYVRIMGFGSDCDDMMFEDFDGSRSHRNGALFLLGKDDIVFDKRASNGFDGKYHDFKKMCDWLENWCVEYLGRRVLNDHHPHSGRFTLESQFCQFKNGFFKRRYPGVYADMAWERIQKYDELGFSRDVEVFKAIRAAHLPDWLRVETEVKPVARALRAAQFADTGFPFNGEHFL